MNETTELDLLDLQLQRSSRRIWIIAFGIAIVSAIPVVLLKETVPWAVAIPICIGIILGLAFELRDNFASTFDRLVVRPGELAIRLSEEHKGLVDYSGQLVLELRKAPPTAQEEFPFLRANQTSRKRVHRVTLQSGEEIAVINCDRFVDALVSELIEESDKIVQYSLLMATRRFGSARPEQLKKKGFITGTITEVIKNDFRGNWMTSVSRTAEKVLKRFENELRGKITLDSPSDAKSAVL